MKVEIEALRRIQRELSLKIVVQDVFKTSVTKISGIDLAFVKEKAIVACVTMSFPSLEDVKKKILETELDFPYIPTLLSFREGPAIVKMINSLRSETDIFLVNAQGIAHPLFCGCASHVGVLTQKPTIGVASSNLCGIYDHEPIEVGEAVPMYYSGRAVGWILKSKKGCRPIFISPGHLVSLESSLKIVKDCLKNHKLPEPLYNAHRLANEERNKRLNQPIKARRI